VVDELLAGAHLGFEPHLEPLGGTGNARNGTTPKTLITEHGRVQIDAPRDRNGSFEPQIVRKRQWRFEGFDEKILGGTVQRRACLSGAGDRDGRRARRSRDVVSGQRGREVSALAWGLAS
jgi:hypothetical protein